jgi:hypothetical protein
MYATSSCRSWSRCLSYISSLYVLGLTNVKLIITSTLKHDIVLIPYLSCFFKRGEYVSWLHLQGIGLDLITLGLLTLTYALIPLLQSHLLSYVLFYLYTQYTNRVSGLHVPDPKSPITRAP